MIRRANAPLPPEESVALRIVTTLAVLAGIGACESVGEISPVSTLGFSAALVTGMCFSWLTRRHPRGVVKLVLAVVVTVVFLHFVQTVLRDGGANLAAVEIPLATLFAWIQVTHAFDVPARRDLLFSLAASAAFVAIASAQAIESSFIGYLAAWLVLCVVALVLSWRSMLGRVGPPPIATMIAATALAAVLAVILVITLPPPQAGTLIALPNSILHAEILPDQGGITGGASGKSPAQAAPATGSLGVGGYYGFAGPLDTAVRTTLGNEVVMDVRATRPGYFMALSYDVWSGTSWLDPAARHLRTINGGSPFAVGSASSGSLDIQTFHVEVPLTNVLIAASSPTEVWFPTKVLYRDPVDNSIRSPVAVTPGTVYTVVSSSSQQSPSALSRDRAPLSAFQQLANPKDLALPHPYPAVQALARQITAGHRGVYAKIAAIEAWMHRNVRYSTNIPPLLPGQDAVTQFLFHGRIGYCEQISTAMAVMLRTLGIPVREATGYVPGPFNPLTGFDQIEAKDAHAWVQVDFPGYGWQSFDPTANVPLTNPDPGALIAADLWHVARNLPLAPIGAVVAGAAAAGGALLLWRRRPRSWAEGVTRRIERAGRRRGFARAQSETLEEYASRLLASGVADGRPLPRRRPRGSRGASPPGCGGLPDSSGPPGGSGPPAATSARPLPGAEAGNGTGTPGGDDTTASRSEIRAAVAVIERAAYGGDEPASGERRAVELTARRLARRPRPG